VSLGSQRGASPRIVVVLLLGFGITACTGSGKQATAPTTGPATSAASRPAAQSATASSVDPSTADVNSAGDIPDNQAFVAFTDTAGAFTVKVPEGWSRTDAANRSVRFTDNFNAIELDLISGVNAPSEQSALATEIPAMQASTAGFELHNVTTVQRTGGQAILIAYHATSAANAVSGKTITLAVERYEFWAGGNEAVVTVSGPLNADNVDPWRTVTDSFAWA